MSFLISTIVINVLISYSPGCIILFLHNLSCKSDSGNQGCQIWHPNWVRSAPNGTNLGLFKPSQNVLRMILKCPTFAPCDQSDPIWMPNVTSLIAKQSVKDVRFDQIYTKWDKSGTY